MKTLYIVKFSKKFVSGNLKGLIYDEARLSFFSLQDASEYISFCNKHSKIPVKSLDSSNYTIHLARIETVSLSNEGVSI